MSIIAKVGFHDDAFFSRYAKAIFDLTESGHDFDESINLSKVELDANHGLLSNTQFLLIELDAKTMNDILVDKLLHSLTYRSRGETYFFSNSRVGCAAIFF